MTDTPKLNALQKQVASAPLNPITLTVSTGRCGTLFMKRLFEAAYGEKGLFLHEHLSAHKAALADNFRCYSAAEQEYMLQNNDLYNEICWMLEEAKRRPVCEFGHYMISAVPLIYRLIPDALRVLIVHRHPVEVAGSLAIRGHYTVNKSRTWALTPMHARVNYPQYTDHWEALSAYEKVLYAWLEINRYATELPQRLPEVKMMTVPSSAIFSSTSRLRKMAYFCGMDPVKIPDLFPRQNAAMDVNRETTPLKREWEKTLYHTEVVKLAETLGYDMSLSYIRERVAHYQRPRGLGPLLRRVSGYWYIRRNIGQWRASRTKHA